MGAREIPTEWESASDLIAGVRDLGRRSLAVDLDAMFVDGAVAGGAIDAMVEAGLFALTLPAR